MAAAAPERIEPPNLRRKASAAIEWRTIPPTIKVRHKKRPPPITIHSKRSFEQLVWTQGPPSASTTATTATPASSITIFTPFTASAPTSAFGREFPKSAGVGQEPRALYYAIPDFQQSPDGPDDTKQIVWPLSVDKLPQGGKTALEVVTEHEYIPFRMDDAEFQEVPSPPASPSVYLTLRPWTLPEYLLLLSIKPLGTQDDGLSWEDVAGKLNMSTAHQPRGAWDCWHRWAVPWCRPAQPIWIQPHTYPHAPGVQHEYKYSELEGLIELWTALSRALEGSQISLPPLTAPAVPLTPETLPSRHLMGRARHPDYPPRCAPPNVPARSLGDTQQRGLSPWFTMSAVNAPMLQRMLESQDVRADDWGPAHLRGYAIPPPPRPPQRATSDPQ
ncbi:hypothetical protein BC834DRAFT_907579 [Gloeopeniophorella convolvens]|nr:hypothetical protein BC834DRAFT_907579 [Gloeopeniophorella convolvens]